MKAAQAWLDRALIVEAVAQADLIAGVSGPAGFRAAATLYWESYEQAPPASYGRLVGMLKAAVLGGGGEEEALRVRALLSHGGASPTAGYAIGIAALIASDDAQAMRAADEIRGAGPAFDARPRRWVRSRPATTRRRARRSARSRPTSRCATHTSRASGSRTRPCFSQHSVNVARVRRNASLGYPGRQ